VKSTVVYFELNEDNCNGTFDLDLGYAVVRSVSLMEEAESPEAKVWGRVAGYEIEIHQLPAHSNFNDLGLANGCVFSPWMDQSNVCTVSRFINIIASSPQAFACLAYNYHAL